MKRILFLFLFFIFLFSDNTYSQSGIRLAELILSDRFRDYYSGYINSTYRIIYNEQAPGIWVYYFYAESYMLDYFYYPTDVSRSVDSSGSYLKVKFRNNKKTVIIRITVYSSSDGRELGYSFVNNNNQIFYTGFDGNDALFIAGEPCFEKKNDAGVVIGYESPSGKIYTFLKNTAGNNVFLLSESTGKIYSTSGVEQSIDSLFDTTGKHVGYWNSTNNNYYDTHWDNMVSGLTGNFDYYNLIKSADNFVIGFLGANGEWRDLSGNLIDPPSGYSDVPYNSDAERFQPIFDGAGNVVGWGSGGTGSFIRNDVPFGEPVVPDPNDPSTPPSNPDPSDPTNPDPSEPSNPNPPTPPESSDPDDLLSWFYQVSNDAFLSRSLPSSNYSTAGKFITDFNLDFPDVSDLLNFDVEKKTYDSISLQFESRYMKWNNPTDIFPVLDHEKYVMEFQNIFTEKFNLSWLENFDVTNKEDFDLSFTIDFELFGVRVGPYDFDVLEILLSYANTTVVYILRRVLLFFCTLIFISRVVSIFVH